MKNLPPFTLCNYKSEAEKIFKCISVNGMGLLDFIEATISNETNAKKIRASFSECKTSLVNNEEFFHQRMLCEVIKCENIMDTFWPYFTIGYNHIIRPIISSEFPLKECDVLGWYISSYDHTLKTPLDSKLSIATIYRFPFKITSKYIINAGYDNGIVYHDDRSHPNYREEFIINISYKNFLATIQLDDNH